MMRRLFTSVNPRRGRRAPSTKEVWGTVRCWAFGHPGYDGQFCTRCKEFWP